VDAPNQLLFSQQEPIEKIKAGHHILFPDNSFDIKHNQPDKAEAEDTHREIENCSKSTNQALRTIFLLQKRGEWVLF
jgi:hypothetical protein